MKNTITDSFLKLKAYCEKEGFKGWDPFDGLNSKIFQATPLKNWRLARHAWIQGFKRSPVNFRKLLLVPKDYNAKGIALFLTGYCNLYGIAAKGGTTYGSKEEILDKINFLADLLIKLKSEGYAGACWGYNFDWQNRTFFQPKGTPTVVATSFAADALFNAFDITGDQKYLEVALSASDFVLKDLNRTYITGDKFIFSYSPKDNSTTNNASLLGSRLLSRCYKYTKNEEFLKEAVNSIQPVVERQNEDGSWVYGGLSHQSYIDSFHTGFNLECLTDYSKNTGDSQFEYAFQKGLIYYLNNFFEEDGKPKYYHNAVYPVDIHAPAQLMVTLAKSDKLKENIVLADKVLDWTIKNMQNPKGYFYYQMKKSVSSKIPYMRWSQAWIFYGLSYYSVKI